MWGRSVLSIMVTAGAMLAFALPAVAGGWAVTTFDALPEGGFRAGETYRLGYTIRQHGDKPFGGAKTEIRIQSGKGGEYIGFQARPDGPVGHYVADVRFPIAGDWTWEVTQEPFPSQKLGTVTALPPLQSSPPIDVSTAAARSNGGELALLRVVLPVSALLAIAVFGQRLISFSRHQRAGADLPTPRVTGGAR